MTALENCAKNILLNNGGPIDADRTVDGKDYVMVLRSDFDSLQYILAGKKHLLGPVIVNADRYKGYAVAIQDNEPDDKVACLLQNGNVWWYPIETIKASTWDQLPRSNRHSYLQRKGYKPI